MAEIIKHTFYVEQVSVVDGELVVGDPIEYTYNFTLLIKGFDLFEREYGKPIMQVLTKLFKETGVEDFDNIDKAGTIKNIINANETLFDAKFIKALACASYVKINNSMPINNDITVQEFKESEVYELVTSDLDFITELLSMTLDCLNRKEENKKKKIEKINVTNKTRKN